MSEPKTEETLEGNFRGKDRPSRVLFLENTHIIHAWHENGTERREPVTTTHPPGTRECKALRSPKSRDFLLCMYWITGPGGGRVDGILFDLKRRTAGEFFSAAINIQLLSTLCAPETMVGPMPSVTMVEWSTKDAEIRVTVELEGWSTQRAQHIRSLSATNEFCECFASEDCAGKPTPPKETKTIVYRLVGDQLHPAPESRKILAEIAAQWGHNAALEGWNLLMRGYGNAATSAGP